MNTKLTHIAISAVDPPLMRLFYSRVFGLHGVSEHSTAGFLTDGYINFALNYRKPGYQAGLDHFGFEVDDLDEVRSRLRELYPSVETTTRPAHRGYVGMASHDPEGHVFDLSYADMGERRRVAVIGERSQRTTRHFHHLAMRALNPQKTAMFYRDVFDLQWAKEPSENQVFHLTDGVMKLVIMPWRVTDFAETGIVERPALDHMGFFVESIADYQEDLEKLIKDNPEAAPWADKRDEKRLRDERAARERLLSRCEYNESQLWDPECVFYDVRERED
jgi:catechol 2,3-dioxygenase-like lactoylglutathione lyase family enzyme